MVFAARLTQWGHAIHSMDDLLALYEKAYTADIPLRFFHTIKPQEQKIRVCAYARVSSDSDDQLNSFSAQVEYFRERMM